MSNDEIQRRLATTPPEFQFDTHKDCSFCPAHVGRKCEAIGTGVHEPIEVHLQRAHSFSQDKTAGLALAARLFGKAETEVFVLAHQGILLFQPVKPTVGYGPDFDIDKRERHA